jgi:hypothetical protein
MLGISTGRDNRYRSSVRGTCNKSCHRIICLKNVLLPQKCFKLGVEEGYFDGISRHCAVLLSGENGRRDLLGDVVQLVEKVGGGQGLGLRALIGRGSLPRQKSLFHRFNLYRSILKSEQFKAE